MAGKVRYPSAFALFRPVHGIDAAETPFIRKENTIDQELVSFCESLNSLLITFRTKMKVIRENPSHIYLACGC